MFSTFITIVGIIFFATLTVAIVFILGILLGFIKPGSKKNNPDQSVKSTVVLVNSTYLPSEIGTPALGKALFAQSPKERWGYQDIEVGQEKIRVPFPDFHWWQLLDPKYSHVLNGLKQELMAKWGEYLTNAHIYAASSAAYYLLKELSPSLNKIGAETRIPDPTDHVVPADKVIIFDIYTTTGQALIRAQRNLPSTENSPTHFLVLIFNDLVPQHEGPSSWWKSNIPQQQYECLYYAGDYVKYWSHQDAAILDALSVIRDAFRGIQGWDWNSARAREAVATLQAVLHSPASKETSAD